MSSESTEFEGPLPVESQSDDDNIEEKIQRLTKLQEELFREYATVREELLRKRRRLRELSRSRNPSKFRDLLPRELFGEILAHLLENDSTVLVRPSQVCRQWRSYITGSPRLWTKLNIRSQSPVNLDGHVRTCLSRSLTLPLSLLIRDPPSIDDVDEQLRHHHCTDWLEAIFDEAAGREWRSITITDHYFCKGPRIIRDRMKKGLLGSLVNLSPLARHPDPDVETWTIDMLPRLKELGYGGDVWRINASTTWPNLTSLELTNVINDLEDVISILRQTTNLRSCSVAFDTPEDDLGPDGTRHLSLPHLRHLGITSQFVARALPEIIHAPQLETLYLNHAECFNVNDLEGYRHLLRRNGGTLKSIRAPGIQADFLIEYFPRLIFLEKLVIFGRFQTSDANGDPISQGTSTRMLVSRRTKYAPARSVGNTGSTSDNVIAAFLKLLKHRSGRGFDEAEELARHIGDRESFGWVSRLRRVRYLLDSRMWEDVRRRRHTFERLRDDGGLDIEVHMRNALAYFELNYGRVTTTTYMESFEEQIRLLDAEADEANRRFHARRTILLDRRARAAVAPHGVCIQSLPPEILLEVFENLVGDDSRSMTCARARGQDEDKVRAYMKVITERVRERPLTLSIESFLDIVLKMVESCTLASLSVVVDQVEDLTPFFEDSNRGNTNQLKTLSLTCRTRDETGVFELDIAGGVVDMQSFTQLTSLTLDFSEEFTDRVLAPWSQLTDLKLTSNMFSLDYLNILRHCVNLEGCSIYPDTAEDVEDLFLPERTGKPVHLPKIRILELLGCFYVPDLIPAKLVCPVLQEICFDYKGYLEIDGGGYMTSFLKQCAPTLKKLRMPAIGLTGRSNEILAPLVELEELTIAGIFSPESSDNSHYSYRGSLILDVWSVFGHLIEQPLCLPGLQVIRLIDQSVEEKHVVEHHLFKFLESRLGKASLLRSVVFRLNSEDRQQLEARRARYSEWESQGVKFDLEE
ncbi:unnamed protein product [Cyclocybe aegerita]|uniref:F-box domain-containing protein n=1 Tax=Cyclocybe aegerita TaxID=1973307 RepID=A0A8S0XE26_CYCAE|nr:unnamed protein product [Cyclocybe aegerita]